uniref:Uncharacterized protein n=1 Tax=Ditylenchus dipsaci TaxID=166011 RepID=A0A915DY30_9BILA
MGILQNALNQAPVPPVIQPIEMQAFVEENNRKNKDGSKQDWRCENYPEKNGGCKASLQTVTTGNVFTSSSRTMEPVRTTMLWMKGGYAQHHQKPMELLNHELQSAPLSCVPSLSSSAVRKTIRRVRIANQIPIVEGRNVQDIDIPRESRMYTDGAGRQQLFFLGDSGRDDAERILLFGKERHIDWSGEMKLMYLDGSFQMTPPPFYQKQIAAHGLSARNQEPEFSLRAKMLMSLAFVPPENIWNDFRLLKTHLLSYDQVLAPVINWFETYYVGTAMRDPMFPVRWWSCYERTLAGETERITLQRLLIVDFTLLSGVDHPNVARFLQDLKEIQRSHDKRYETT